MKWSLVTGAAVALAGCAIPPHQALVSQLDMPEFRLPGEARWYATTCQECEGGCGIAVRIIDGRAKKIEGIPTHPINHGKTCARSQSGLQALYNPDRLTSSLSRDGNRFTPVSDWTPIYKTLSSQLSSGAANHGEMLWITPPLHGTSGALVAALAGKAGARLWVMDFPGAKPERTAMKALTGKSQLPYYELDKADYVVNFGSDFLVTGHSAVHNGWAYGEFRQGKNRRDRGILVTFSPRMNVTAANSDRWIPVRPGSEGWVALGLGNLVSQSKGGPWPSWAKNISLSKISEITGVSEAVFHKLAARLVDTKHVLAVGGLENGAYTNGVWSLWIIQSLNRLLSGKMESFEPSSLIPVSGEAVSKDSLISTRDAMAALKNGKIKTAWVLGTNPRYLLPESLNFDTLFSNVKNKVVFSPFMNETALLADTIVATQTWLEEWGDRLVEMPGENRIYNIQQPVVMGRPGSMSLSDILIAAAKQSGWVKQINDVQDAIKNHFKDELGWESVIARGGTWPESSLDWELYTGASTHPLYPPPALKTKEKPPAGMNLWDSLSGASVNGPQEAAFSGDGQILIAFYSPNLGDGKLANRPWMQELADPITTVVWTHWVEIPAPLAKKLGIERGDLVRLTSSDGKSLQGPAFPNPALHPEAVAVPVGQGHDSYGQYADRGENPLSILNPEWQKETGELAWTSTRVNVEKLSGKVRMTALDRRVDALPREAMPQ